MSKGLPKLLKQSQADRLIILGDLCEEKDRHGAWLVNRVVAHLDRLSRICPVVINPGNHDYLDEDSPFFEFVKRLEGITWIKRPTVHEGNLYLPHTNNWKRDWEGVDWTETTFAHNTFTGARSEHGRELEGIPLEAVKKARNVVSGDVHVPQDFKNVTYVGAPYTIDFGDSFKPRMLIDTPTEFIEVPCTGPRKVLVESTFDGPRQGQSDVPAADNISLSSQALKEGDILKVRITIKRKHFKHWAEIKKTVREWAASLGCVCYSVHPVVEGAQGTGARAPSRRARKRKDDKTILREYAAARGVEDVYLKVGEELL